MNPYLITQLHNAMANGALCREAAAEIERLRSQLHLTQFKVDILENNEQVHLARLRSVDPEWVAAEARLAEDGAWWESNGRAELAAHLRSTGFKLARDGES